MTMNTPKDSTGGCCPPPPCSPCPIQKAFVRAVMHRCVDLEWNATQLAEKAGVSKGHWSEIRNMKKSPTMESMVRIARAVGLEVSWTLKEPMRFRQANRRLSDTTSLEGS